MNLKLYSENNSIYYSDGIFTIKISDDEELIRFFEKEISGENKLDIMLKRQDIEKIITLLTEKRPLPGDEEIFPLLCDNFHRIADFGWEKYRKHIRKRHKREVKDNYIKAITDMDFLKELPYVKNQRAADTFAENIPDALLLSLHNLGCIDIEYIACTCRETVKNVISALKGTIFQNPEKWDESFYKGWETAGEYLSGNVYLKIEKALAANKKYQGYFSDNVAALKKILPPKLGAEQIYVTLGSPWIPPELIDDFINLYIGRKTSESKVCYDASIGLWHIPYKRNYIGNIIAENVYGTKRMNALAIIEHTLNKKQVDIYDEIPDASAKNGKKRVLNTEETALAAEKQKEIVSEFKKWIWQDAERKKRLEQIYNEKFGGIRPRKYNGLFLKFPEMSDDVKLYDYQKNAVARIMMSPNTLLAYEVGAGKTFIMIAAGMEMRRIGISRKNMYVVPNGIVGQWEEMFKRLYPKSHILVVDPHSFAPKKRNEILIQMKCGDYDGILIAYSCFGMIRMSLAYEESLLNKKIEKIKTSNAKRNTDAIKEEIYRLRRKRMFENEIYFDELGINTLFVDEAHNFKNVPICTKIRGVAGISSAGSEKCAKMMEKVKFVQRKNNGRGVVFATGTPITNSLTDIYIMQKYLQDQDLCKLGIGNFDEWVGMFAERVTELEVDVGGTGFRTVTRFSQFHNLPELAALFGRTADFFKVHSMIGIPEFHGYTDVVIPRTDKLSQYMSELASRVDTIRGGIRTKDNMLKITTDGRKAALDIRLVNIECERSEVDEHFKAYSCARRVFGIYMSTAADKLTQVVFCDWAVFKKGGAVGMRGGDIYTELKELLVTMGVKPDEIVFIHDTTDENRQEIFDAVRHGKIRIIIGSTAKLGTGVNIQDRLIALHHLDVPWRPADMIQREGRILRSGNMNKEVKIYRYITKGSFDAYSWQILESKQKIITEILGDKLGVRDCEDIDGAVLNFAEAKALAAGNKFLKQRIQKANELSRYILLQKNMIQIREQLEEEMCRLPNLIEYQKRQIEKCSADISHYTENKRKYSAQECAKIRDLIRNTLEENVPVQDEVICEYQGFQIVFSSVPSNNEAIVFVQNEGKYRLALGKSGGYMKKIDNLLNNLGSYRDKLCEEKQRLEEKLSDAASSLENMYSYSEQIEKLRAEITEIDNKLEV